jgi:hypothetical protein
MSEIARDRAALSLDFWVGSHLLHGSLERLGTLRLGEIAKSGTYEPIEVRAEGGRRNGCNFVD